ncbi:lipoprotein carrier protein LolA [Cupriavidus sp. USMAHM13]|uniref:outer membrane lipoprotein carrier protein LolA n=1 Tax=Cupriavidus sp. USMAHM13 TaxID=1389192 RepID=UPI0008A707D4|nr:outer membrane lipoprotein carrier protein LolA [Cupriavidus sp. USMAHM13]AOZ02815.1 lipoprotein carrier protein LolA [Cupriavidus sp. USMAHM13]
MRLGQAGAAGLLALLLGSGALAAPPPAQRASAPAADVLAGVAARLDPAPVVHGRFEQTRHLAGFANPLVARGDFVLARGRGVSWQTREPFVSSLLVTPERLVMRGADGTVQQQLQADAQPAMRQVAQTVMAMLQGDLRALAARFQAEGKLAGAHGWSLSLVPADAGLRRAFSRIELSGDRFVRSVRWEEAGGDSTLVRMIEPGTAARLTPEQERRFD